MANRTRSRLFLVIVAVFAAAVAVAGAVLWQYGGTWASRALVEQLEARLPGRVTLGAPVQWQLFPPTVRVSGLQWRAPASARGQIDIAEFALRTAWAGEGSADARPVGVEISGVRAELFEDAAGQWTLPQPSNDGATGGEALAWTLAGVSLSDSRLVLHPQAAPPVTLDIDRATLEPVVDTGAELGMSANIAQGDDIVQGTLSATLQVNDDAVSLVPLTLTLKGERGVLAGASLQIEAASALFDAAGTASAATMTARAQFTREAQRAELQADIKDAQFTAGALQANIARLELTLPPPADAAMSLADATLSADVTALDLSPLAGTLRWQGAQTAIDVALTDGSARYAFAEQRLEASLRDWRAQLPDPSRADAQVTISGTLEGHFSADTLSGEGSVEAQAESSHLVGQWQIEGRQAQWARLQGRIDALDLDRWLPPQAGKSRQAAPLDAWRDLPLQLDMQVGALRWQGLHVRDARLQLNAGEVDQLRAE